MATDKLKAHLVKHLHELPVLPQAVVQLMALDPDDDTFFDRLLEVIQREPGYASRVVAAANSAASSSRDPISTLPTALSRIGSKGAAQLILALSVIRVFVPRDDWEKGLWRHALQVAIASQEIARAAHSPRVDPDEAYLCGLLHDIGRFVLFQQGPETLRQIDEGEWHNSAELQELERSFCGLTHAELGAMACAHWGLPQRICECVRHHHDRQSDAGDAVAMLVEVVYAADRAMFPSTLPGGTSYADADDDTLRVRVQARLPSFVVLDLAQTRELLKRVMREAEVAAQAIGVG